MKQITRRSALLGLGAAAVAAPFGLRIPAAFAEGPAPAADPGAQLAAAATDLVLNLGQTPWPAQSAHNFYPDPGVDTELVFGTPGQPETYRNVTRCATFVRRLMSHQFPDWATRDYFVSEFGDSFPNSAEFHDALEGDRAGGVGDDVDNFNGFNMSFLVYLNLRPGDLLAIKYVGSAESDSGHMAIVGSGSRLFDDSHPTHREWAIPVIDSSSSPHGDPTVARSHDYPDTRFYRDPISGAWKEASGVGMGWMFFRTRRSDGRVIAHRWSRIAGTWHDTTARPIVMGRINIAS